MESSSVVSVGGHCSFTWRSRWPRRSRARSSNSSVGEARRRKPAVVCQQPPVVPSAQFGDRWRSRAFSRRGYCNRGRGLVRRWRRRAAAASPMRSSASNAAEGQKESSGPKSADRVWAFASLRSDVLFANGDASAKPPLLGAPSGRSARPPAPTAPRRWFGRFASAGVRGRLPSATAATGANRGYGEGSRGSGEDCWLVGSGDGLENGARQHDRLVAITSARLPHRRNS